MPGLENPPTAPAATTVDPEAIVMECEIKELENAIKHLVNNS